jgi:hypothetical protein
MQNREYYLLHKQLPNLIIRVLRLKTNSNITTDIYQYYYYTQIVRPINSYVTWNLVLHYLDQIINYLELCYFDCFRKDLF